VVMISLFHKLNFCKKNISIFIAGQFYVN